VSLKGRLLAAVVAVVAAGLLVSDAATFAALRAYLLGRVDQQVAVAREALTGLPNPALRLFGRDLPARQGFEASGLQLYVELRLPDGSSRKVLADAQGRTLAPPSLPASLLAPGEQAAAYTVHGAGDRSVRYRVQVGALAGGGAVVVAAPLTEVDQTLGRLLWILGLGSLAALLLLSLVALRLIRLSLHPLDEIAATASGIAAGDLSRRVGRAEPRTEIGRLGLSLNAMLGQIEAAFSERRASEQRLRRFVADASHELRTPLTSIRGYAELFRRGAEQRPRDLAVAMRRIEGTAERMGVLVDELLLLARLDQGRPLRRDPVDLTRLGADLVADAKVVEPERPITLRADGPVRVVGDEDRLRQAGANLLANVRAHTPPGTAAEVRVQAEDGRAVLEVADQGPGLTPEQSGRVFERFYRADPSRSRASGGSGLGLSIVAAIATAHDGRAGVASTPGRGATFRIELPLAPG
jgi:two-component system OmpR family sensor kinase